MKQITIYEFLGKYKNTALLDGYKYVGYDKYGWWAFKEEPESFHSWVIDFKNAHRLIPDIAPFDGDWKDSLIKCGESAIIKKHKKEK